MNNNTLNNQASILNKSLSQLPTEIITALIDFLATGRKQCRLCGKYEPLSNFYKNKAAHDGLGSYCKVCDKLKAKEWYEQNKGNK